MYDVLRINKDCFWDYTFTSKEILDISESGSDNEKAFLFSKILLNSSEMLQDLEIFDIKDIKNYIKKFKIPSFNYEYVFKRKNIAEVYFLKKELLVDELRWVS